MGQEQFCGADRGRHVADVEALALDEQPLALLHPGQQIAPIQADTFDEAIERQRRRAVGLEALGIVEQCVEPPDVDVESVPTREADPVAVGADEVGGVSAGPPFLEDPEEEVQRRPEVAAGGILVGLGPQRGHHGVAGGVGVDDQIAEQGSHPLSPPVFVGGLPVVEEELLGPEQLEPAGLFGRKRHRREELLRCRRDLLHRVIGVVAEPAAGWFADDVEQPLCGGSGLGATDRPGGRDELTRRAQEQRRDQLPGIGGPGDGADRVEIAGLVDGAKGEPELEVAGRQGHPQRVEHARVEPGDQRARAVVGEPGVVGDRDAIEQLPHLGLGPFGVAGLVNDQQAGQRERDLDLGGTPLAGQRLGHREVTSSGLEITDARGDRGEPRMGEEASPFRAGACSPRVGVRQQLLDAPSAPPSGDGDDFGAPDRPGPGEVAVGELDVAVAEELLGLELEPVRDRLEPAGHAVAPRLAHRGEHGVRIALGQRRERVDDVDVGRRVRFAGGGEFHHGSGDTEEAGGIALDVMPEAELGDRVDLGGGVAERGEPVGGVGERRPTPFGGGIDRLFEQAADVQRDRVGRDRSVHRIVPALQKVGVFDSPVDHGGPEGGDREVGFVAADGDVDRSDALAGIEQVGDRGAELPLPLFGDPRPVEDLVPEIVGAVPAIVVLHHREVAEGPGRFDAGESLQHLAVGPAERDGDLEQGPLRLVE